MNNIFHPVELVSCKAICTASLIMVKVSLLSLAVSAACFQNAEGFTTSGFNSRFPIQWARFSRLAATEVVTETKINRPVYYAPRTFTSSPVIDSPVLELSETTPEIQSTAEINAPMSTIKPIDEILQTSVLSSGQTRQQRLEQVSSQLNKSIMAKRLAEEAIVSEIEELRAKLASELEEEIMLRQEISSLAEELENAISQKTVQLQEEEALLVQLETVKTQVKEEKIFSQIEEAANVKTELISIESIVIEDLKDCKSQMMEELGDALLRIERMKNALEKLPVDVEESRSYTWDEVQELQQLLLDSFENLQRRDMRIGILKRKFADATEQKAIALGEIDVMTDDSQLPQGMVGSSNEEVNSEIEVVASSKEVKVTITPDMTEQDILKQAGDSSVKAFQETGQALNTVSKNLGAWIKSEEGQESASELIDAIEASKKIIPALSEAAKSAKKEWDTKFVGEELTTFDKLFKGFKAALDAVQNSEDVQKALDTASTSAEELKNKTGSATKKTFGAIKTTTTDKQVLNMLSEALVNLQKSVISLAVAGTKFVEKVNTDRLLPPPKQTGTKK